MGTNFTPLKADMFLFCYERDCFMSLFLMINNLILLKLLTQLQDIWTTL